MNDYNPPNSLPFRPCVGIALFNDKGEVFMGERRDHPDSWQMPQGGIDDGETVEEAFFREMREEIGTDKAKILKIHDKKLRYNLPPRLLGKLWDGRWGGQEQTWVAALFTGTNADIDLAAFDPPEFGRWQWADLDRAIDLIVHFKRRTYEQVMDAFKDVIPDRKI